jgi:hypothetical protein
LEHTVKECPLTGNVYTINLSVIRTIETYTDEKGVVVYTTGNLTRYEDAMKLQNQVNRKAYKMLQLYRILAEKE